MGKPKNCVYSPDCNVYGDFNALYTQWEYRMNNHLFFCMQIENKKKFTKVTKILVRQKNAFGSNVRCCCVLFEQQLYRLKWKLHCIVWETFSCLSYRMPNRTPATVITRNKSLLSVPKNEHKHLTVKGYMCCRGYVSKLLQCISIAQSFTISSIHTIKDLKSSGWSLMYLEQSK